MKHLTSLELSLQRVVDIFHEVSGELDKETVKKFNMEQKKIVQSMNGLQLYFYPQVEFPWKGDEKFAEAWGMWKNYKKQEFKFTFQSAISEQAALKKLARVSNGDMQTALAIIMQSMENGWQGLFPLKQSEKVNTRAQNTGYKQKLLERLTRQS